MDDEASFRGKIIDLRPARMGHPHLKWRVILQVEAVLSGTFSEHNFIFGIHSPAKSRIVKGGRYTIHGVRKSSTEFIVKSVNPWTETVAGKSEEPICE